MSIGRVSEHFTVYAVDVSFEECNIYNFGNNLVNNARVTAVMRAAYCSIYNLHGLIIAFIRRRLSATIITWIDMIL